MVQEGETAELRRWRLGWWLGLIALVALMFPLVHVASERVRERQAREELLAMKTMLEAYYQRYAGWPPANSPTELLAAFRGKLDAQGRPVDDRWFLKDIRLHYLDANPDAPFGAVLDPWGRPYQYFRQLDPGGRGQSYVLFSSGADGRYSDPVKWGEQAGRDATEDRDNIVITDRR